MVLVVGSTGKLGSAIVWRLRRDGISVRALVRPTSNRTVLEGSGAEFVMGDLRDRESLRVACRGCEAVATTASSSRRPRQFDLERIDRQGNLNLIDAAKAEGVRHFVLTSTVGADAPGAPRIFRNKHFIEERLAASGLRYTVLRPAGFMENLVSLIQWVRRTGWAIISAPGTTKTSYIAIRDIAEMVRMVLEKPPTSSPVIEFGGPEDLSLLDCVGVIREVLGRRVRVLRVPMKLLRPVGWVALPFTQALDAVFEIFEFVERKGLRADKKFLAEYPLQLTSFRSFVGQQLGLSIGPG